MAVETLHIPGELLVQFRPGVAQERVAEILSAHGLIIERDLGMPLAYLTRSVGALTLPELIASLHSYPEVVSVEPNRVRRIGPPSPPVPAKPAPNG
jgi:hypothetical protein